MKYLNLTLLLLSGCMANKTTLLPQTSDPVSLDVTPLNNETSHTHETVETTDDLFHEFLQAMDDVVHTHDIDFTPEEAISYAIAVYGTEDIDYVYQPDPIAFADGVGYYIGVEKADDTITVLFITDSGEIHEER